MSESSSGTHGLAKTATWKSAVTVSLGGSLLVAVSLGPMAAELGVASVAVWCVAALVGVLQCLAITELALLFPDKSGGTPVYTHEAFKDVSPWFGALSNWGYWLGWIPVIPVNLVLAGGYLQASFFPETSPMLIAGLLAIPLCLFNYFGLKAGVVTSAIMAALAIIPLAIVALSPVFQPSLFHPEFITPFVPLNGSWTSGASWMLMVKWLFVAVWSAYAFESASTVVAELRDPKKDTSKAMLVASTIGTFAYCFVPFMLLAVVGTDTLSKDPALAFLPAATAIFGPAGASIITVMLVGALLLGAQTALIGSSRALFEMSKDGQMIKQFAHTNRYGTPDRGLAWSMFITVALLAIFQSEIVALVAASNVGYLVPFMLVLPAYAILRRRHPEKIAALSFRMPKSFTVVALALAVFNWALFLVGGPQWGTTVMITGVGLMATVVPFYLYRTKVQDRVVKSTETPAQESQKKAA